jgi:hypothetical protein
VTLIRVLTALDTSYGQSGLKRALARATKKKRPTWDLFSFQNLILTASRADVRANRDGGLSTPVRSYSNHGKAHGGVSQRLRRCLCLLRKHPLPQALAPLSRRQARLGQWRQLRFSSWVLSLVLSLLVRMETGLRGQPFRIIFEACAQT